MNEYHIKAHGTEATLVTVRTRSDPVFPVGIDLRDNPGNELPLTLDELRDLRGAIDAVIEDVESAGYVQVSMFLDSVTSQYGHLWTYADPTGELQLGDIVRVPFGRSDEIRLARVQRRGRGNYPGPTKTVLAKLEEVPL